MSIGNRIVWAKPQKREQQKNKNSRRCSTTNSFYQYILPWNQTHLGIHINERGTEKSATVRRSKNGFKNILCGEIRRNLNAETTSGIMPIQYECHPYAYVYTAIRASELLLHFATHSKPQEQIDWIEFITCYNVTGHPRAVFSDNFLRKALNKRSNLSSPTVGKRQTRVLSLCPDFLTEYSVVGRKFQMCSHKICRRTQVISVAADSILRTY